MKLKVILVISFGLVALVRADDTVAQAQQALKDQGFYYGEITGEKNVDTMAAVRRYQIRNGLQVTGELDSDTIRSLATNASEPAMPAVINSPSPRPNTQTRADEPTREIESEPERGPQPFTNRPQNDGNRPGPDRFGNGPAEPPNYPSSQATIVPPGGGLFAGTPYASAPPEVQSDLIASAQRILERRELYRGDIDGVYGPNMEFSLRAYQSRVGIPVTGRLDLDTLAALNLLRGAHMPPFLPHRQVVRPRFEQPIRGEWIRE